MYDENIKKQIIGILADYPEVIGFLDSISKLGDLLFFGGSIRDYYIDKKYNSLPRDFDIAIKFHYKKMSGRICETNLEKIIKNYEYRKNRFGGYKLKVEGLEFDIWNMDKTWAFREKKVPKDEKNLIDTVYLNIDGIVYNYNKNILYDTEIEKSLNQKLIDIVLEDNPQKELNLLRALVFKKKYDLELSQRLIRQFEEKIKHNSSFHTILYNIQFSHYKEERLSIHDIEKELCHMTIH